jgi:uroporphyrinogen decarboxylase
LGKRLIDELHTWLEAAVAPQPAPPAAPSRDIVRQAIEFAEPPRIPYSFVEPLRSDFFELAELERILERAGAASDRSLGEPYRDEWDVGLEVAKGLFDRVVDHPLADLAGQSEHRFPDVGAGERFERILPFVRRAHEAGKYVVAGDPVLLFERLRSLMGFEALMLAPTQQRAGFEALLDRLADLTVESIRGFARLGGVDAFMTWQDFGLQTGLAFSLETFRELYAPGLARVVRAAHDAGMHFIWHCCGQIFDLIPEMIDMGVDVVQLDQPRLIGHRRLADAFGGDICFWNAVDTQWCTQDDLSDADLRAEVAAMTEPFRRFRGGFMARHYPQPRDIGLSRHFHEVTAGAFLADVEGCTDV